jgi:hypothetical protein
MPDPVAWTLIEPGWKVRDSEGEEVGRVHEITGDENADIFDGVAIRSRMLAHPTYVPSEHVAEIRQGEIVLDLSRDQIDRLDRFTEPQPQEQVLPESSRWYERLAQRLFGGR